MKSNIKNKIAVMMENKKVKKATFNAVKGILDILFRMYSADESGVTFEEFCHMVEKEPFEAFYSRPIKPKA